MKDMTWIDCHHHNPKAQTGGARGSTQEPDQGMRPGAVEGSMLKPMEPSAAAALPVPSGRASQRGGPKRNPRPGQRGRRCGDIMLGSRTRPVHPLAWAPIYKKNLRT